MKLVFLLLLSIESVFYAVLATIAPAASVPSGFRQDVQAVRMSCDFDDRIADCRDVVLYVTHVTMSQCSCASPEFAGVKGTEEEQPALAPVSSERVPKQGKLLLPTMNLQELSQRVQHAIQQSGKANFFGASRKGALGLGFQRCLKASLLVKTD